MNQSVIGDDGNIYEISMSSDIMVSIPNCCFTCIHYEDRELKCLDYCKLCDFDITINESFYRDPKCPLKVNLFHD